MIKLNWLLRQSQTFLFQYNKGAQRTSNSDAKLWTHRDEIGWKWVSYWRKLVLLVFLIFRYHLVCERDGDWRSLPRPQGLPQRRCHPLLLVHQHCQLWPDANRKILNISILGMSSILHFCQGHFEYNFTNPGDYDVEVTAIAYFNAGKVNPTIRPSVCLHRINFD